MNIKTLLIRSISGLVYVTLITGAILLGNMYFLIVFGLLAFLSIREFHILTNMQENVEVIPYWSAITGFTLFIGVYIDGCFIYLYALMIIAYFINEIFGKKNNPIHNISYMVFGQLYIALPFAVMAKIIESYYHVLLAIFVFIWVNDTFAYLTGSIAGKHKLCERISPNKSWEGVFGGLVGALAIAVLYYFTLPDDGYEITYWLGLAAVVVIFGTVGDLFESLLKRTLGVKDSGNIMPGHGGLLDRMDSVIFVVVPVVIYHIIVTGHQ